MHSQFRHILITQNALQRLITASTDVVIFSCSLGAITSSEPLSITLSLSNSMHWGFCSPEVVLSGRVACQAA